MKLTLQPVLKSSANFKDSKKNLAVFEDEKGFLRCQGRIEMLLCLMKQDFRF